MSEEEKTPTTGIGETPEKNGMGGILEKSGGSSPEEPQPKKRGRPRKVPGDPKNKPATIGEYIAMHPSVAEQVNTNVRGRTTTYPAEMSVDEIAAREIDRHMEIMALPRVNTNSLSEVQGRYLEYMAICKKYGKRMTVGGFAEALGVSRQKMWAWCSGNLAKPKEVVDFINFAIASANAELEDLMISNKINPVAGIFLLKQAGYKDNIEMTVKADAGVEKTEEQLAEEYLSSIPTVDD